jgi:D-tagatose-1,6-bisphosphate aldolase subunit GatZ/KbaZ
VKSLLAGKQRANERLRGILQANRQSGKGGVYSVCSAHPSVLDAALRRASEDGSVVLVESTSSQVNQEGGYTGQKPETFAGLIRLKAKSAGLEEGQLVLGGDHLGPFPWRNEHASTAMEKACALVSACVLAGYQKIHLDASMSCSDDSPGPLDSQIVAERAAALAAASEAAYANLPAASDLPVYVIGTEVPVPGGETAEGSAPIATTSDHVADTLEAFRAAFIRRGLSAAWERVIALVVQPGVEFGDDVVFPYERAKALHLSRALPRDINIVYEAHSTDYQSGQALRELVEDHFAILKVGPELTFAFREAIFALSAIERELLGGDKAVKLSEVPAALENAMLQNPKYWRAYYHGDEAKLRFSRAYSYSDRCRYYWPEEAVQKEVSRLLENLKDKQLPPTIISQYLPLEYERFRAGTISTRPADLIRSHIDAILRRYAGACTVHQ